MKNWLFLAIAIFGEVVATSALKSSHGFTKLVPSVVVVAGYGLAFYFLSLALKSIPVGIAYAVWAGLGIVLVAAIAWIFHGQKLDLWAFVGMGLIVSGVAVLNLLSKVIAHLSGWLITVHSTRRRFAARLNSGVSRTPTAPRKKETKPFLLPKRKTPYGGVLGKCVSTTPCRSQCHAVLFRRLLDANLSKIWHKLS